MDAPLWRKWSVLHSTSDRPMRNFEYEIVDQTGRIAKGRGQAASVTDLARELNAEGHTVIEVREFRAARYSPFRRRISVQDRITALHELATLLESGVPLGDAVQAQAGGTRHHALAASFEAVARALMRGQSFVEALRAGGQSFPAYVYHLVDAGELNGQLAEALRQAVEQMQYDQRVAAEMRDAAVLPVDPDRCRLHRGAPRLRLRDPPVLESSRGRERTPSTARKPCCGRGYGSTPRDGRSPPPLPSSPSRPPCSCAVNGSGSGSGTACRPYRSWVTGSPRPIPRNWASIMSAMLTSRVSLMDSLSVAVHSVRISRRRATLQQAANDVRGGVSLSAALEKRRALTPTGYSLLRAGEQSGQLAKLLEALATLYGREQPVGA